MNWKSIIIGSIITLAITIIAGIVVYYFTVKKDSNEKLVYNIEKPLGFLSDSNSVRIQNIYLLNLGEVVANNVDFVIEYSPEITIKEKGISISSGISESYSITKDSSNYIKIKITSLAPKEQLNVSILLSNAAPNIIPKVSGKSDKTLAESNNINSTPIQVKRFNEVLILILPLIIMLQLALLAVVYLRRFVGVSNNTGFLFIHKKLNNEAIDIFEQKILSKGGDSIELSNYALALALNSDMPKANKVLSCSQYYTRQKSNAVILFNSALINFLEQDLVAGKVNLENSLIDSKKEILRYIDISEVVTDLRANPAIDRIFRDAII